MISIALVVLIAAVCHAAWNTIVKAQPNPFIGYVVLLSLVSCLSLIGVFYYEVPPRESWNYLALSVSLYFAYNYLLVVCYRFHGHINGLSNFSWCGTADYRNWWGSSGLQKYLHHRCWSASL